MGNWPPPHPLSILTGCYRLRACHVYFHEWMFHYNREQHGWKSHQRCKRIRRDRLFPLAKKGRRACCIVVPLIKSRRGTDSALSSRVDVWAFLRAAAPTMWANTWHTCSDHKIHWFFFSLVSGFEPQGAPGPSPEGSVNPAVTPQRDEVVEVGWMICVRSY